MAPQTHWGGEEVNQYIRHDYKKHDDQNESWVEYRIIRMTSKPDVFQGRKYHTPHPMAVIQDGHDGYTVWADVGSVPVNATVIRYPNIIKFNALYTSASDFVGHLYREDDTFPDKETLEMMDEKKWKVTMEEIL